MGFGDGVRGHAPDSRARRRIENIRDDRNARYAFEDKNVLTGRIIDAGRLRTNRNGSG